MPKDTKGKSGQSPFNFKSDANQTPGQSEAQNSGRSPVLSKGTRRQKRAADPFRPASADEAIDKKESADELFSAPSKDADNPGTAYGYHKRLFGRRDEVSVYNAQMDERHALDRRVRVLVIAAVIMLLCIPVLSILPNGLFGPGKPAVTPALLGEHLGRNATALLNWVSGGPVTSGISIVVLQLVATAIVGAALALNGCIFQGALKNALASPSTLGVMSGGTLGTLIYTLLFGVPVAAGAVTSVSASELQAQLDSMDIGAYLFATQGRALCSLAGCFIVVGLVLAIAYIAGRGRVSKVALVVAGQVFAALISGVIAIIRSYLSFYGTDEQREALQNVVGGTIGDITSVVSLLFVAVPVLIGTFIILRLRFRLNLLAFSDEEAKAMGISTMFTRNTVILICTIMTAVVVSFVGNVGFVGFLVPHIARKVIGPDFRYLIPASLLFGATFLMLANYLMNLTAIFSGSLGTLTSLVGAVAFLVIAIRERARGNVDWI